MVVTVIHETPQVQIKKSSRQDLNNVRMEKPQQIPHDKYKYVPKPVMQVAEGMETQFTDHLMREMKKSSGTQLGSAERIYQSMLDSERAKMMAQSNSGIGIKDVVIRELYPQFQQVDYKQSHKNKVEMYKKINSQKGERL